MSPRPGGEAEKLGNHYEGAWIVWQLLEVLAGRALSVTIEELGDIGKGVEFTLRRPTITEVHQVKRQHGSANSWNLSALRSEGVLESARYHVAAGREFHFVSTIPSRTLQDLAERARHSADLWTFVNTLPKNTNFDYLSSTVYGTAQVAWETLRGIWPQCIDERLLRNWNAALAGHLLVGAPGSTAAVTLGDLAVEHLSSPLDRQTICEQLAAYELELAEPGVSRPLAQALSEMHTSWKASVERELLKPLIRRAEVEQLLGTDRRVLAMGPGGAGKSAVLHGVVERAESEGWAVLALRLDRLEPFSSTYELGQRFGLETSPVSALARIAQTRPSLLVVDQLDAVSKASGRMPQSFDAVADLIGEASAFSDMHVLLACRKFDADNDDRIRTLIHDHETKQIEVVELSDEQVVEAVRAMGIASAQLTQQQMAILHLPLHLKLLSTIADQAENFSFTTTRELFDAYWDRKRRDCAARKGSSIRFTEVIAALADEMSARQRLSVSASALDEMDLSNDADILASEHVIVRDGQQLRFFHESFFDYAFARLWMRRRQSLVEFLLEGEQELFRRSQVRQILSYMQEEDSERFVVEVEGLLLEPRVRFHIKHVALDFLKDLQAPTTAEWHMVERLLTQELPFADRLWIGLSTVSWFDRLEAEGVFDGWLRADDARLQTRALEVMLGGVKERPDRIAVLLAPFADQSARYPEWLRWVTRFADIDQSRKLFELVLAAITRGEYDGYEAALFTSVYTLGTRQPEWGVELLTAYLVDRTGAMTLDESGRILTLRSREHGAIELVTSAAAGAPRSFSLQLVPYMLSVMELTSEGELSINSRHFAGYGMRRNIGPPYHQIEGALIVAAVGALRDFVQQQPDMARPLLDQLAADRHEAAQWLLYETLAAADDSYADYAAQLLLDRERGLYAAEPWTVRRPIRAICPYLPAETFAQLERAVIEFRPSWEGRPRGYGSFTLLSAMTEARLSSEGLRRLGELRRLFGVDEPTEPRVTSGFLGSPIPQEAASRMTDEQWLRAIAKHDDDREDWTTLQGGARELSSVLKEEVKESPARFARLALSLGSDAHSAYTEAILMGLAESDVPIDPDLVFQCIRHIASLGKEENDRWLGWALQKHLKAEIPNDIIELLVDRAIHSKDPAGDSSSESFDDESLHRDELIAEGINTARGQLVERLGDILVHDADGGRTALVVSALDQLASDPSIAVRACTAHLIAACVRHARPKALTAFQRLIQADDVLLASRHTENLIAHIANGDTAEAEPIIRRMLSSDQESVRVAGGRLAAYVGLEFESTELLSAIRTTEDSAVRKGIAYICFRCLPYTANAPAAGELVQRSANDLDDEVRKEVASLPVALRGRNLRPFAQELSTVIASPAFPHAVAQLLMTLDQAPDRVDDLIIKCAQRFLEISGGEAGDISTSVAAEAHELGELILRAYAQAADATSRATALDLVDSLLATGAYGFPELVDMANR